MKTLSRLIVLAALLMIMATPLSAQQNERPLSPVGTQVIAHRGHWNVEGSAQNSRRSLQLALDMDIYGSEIDIWLTTDGHLMVNHDASYEGVTLQDATAAECRALTLKNGEHMPELKDMLKLLKTSKTRTKLIIEIKECRTLKQNLESARRAVKAVRKAGMQQKVEYISFSLAACIEVARLDPDAQVAYLSGWVSPTELHKLGITGLDYHLSALQKHPEWVSEAHKLGMYLNVWTIDSDEHFREFRNMGVDFITTNNPEGAVRVCNE